MDTILALHGSSQSMTHALYHLAASPEYQQLLREEVEPLVSAEGWSKATMGKMRKLDSFMKESQRYNGISLSKPDIPALLRIGHSLVVRQRL